MREERCVLIERCFSCWSAALRLRTSDVPNEIRVLDLRSRTTKPSSSLGTVSVILSVPSTVTVVIVHPRYPSLIDINVRTSSLPWSTDNRCPSILSRSGCERNACRSISTPSSSDNVVIPRRKPSTKIRRYSFRSRVLERMSPIGITSVPIAITTCTATWECGSGESSVQEIGAIRRKNNRSSSVNRSKWWIILGSWTRSVCEPWCIHICQVLRNRPSSFDRVKRPCRPDVHRARLPISLGTVHSLALPIVTPAKPLVSIRTLTVPSVIIMEMPVNTRVSIRSYARWCWQCLKSMFFPCRSYSIRVWWRDLFASLV